MAELFEVADGRWEIASPVFHGSITVDAAREFAARLNELADEADERNRREPTPKKRRHRGREYYGDRIKPPDY